MKFEKIKTLKILEFTHYYSLMLMVRLKDILHIDTPDWDSWEDWGEEMESSIKLLSTGVDSLLSAMVSFNQADLRNMMDS